MKVVIVGLAVLFSSSALAMNSSGVIAKILTWADYTGGVYLIQLDTVNSQCSDGYWLDDSQSRASANILASALSAYHSKSAVKIYADENNDWPTRGGQQCKIQLLVLE